jgi:hypothetical protein
VRLPSRVAGDLRIGKPIDRMSLWRREVGATHRSRFGRAGPRGIGAHSRLGDHALADQVLRQPKPDAKSICLSTGGSGWAPTPAWSAVAADPWASLILVVAKLNLGEDHGADSCPYCCPEEMERVCRQLGLFSSRRFLSA